MVKLSWADHLRMEAEKQRKSIVPSTKSVDFYDTDILEKASRNSKLEVENRKPDTYSGDERQEFDLEFHEQYFS